MFQIQVGKGFIWRDFLNKNAYGDESAFRTTFFQRAYSSQQSCNSESSGALVLNIYFPYLPTCVSTPCKERKRQSIRLQSCFFVFKPKKLFSWAVLFMDSFSNILSKYPQLSINMNNGNECGGDNGIKATALVTCLVTETKYLTKTTYRRKSCISAHSLWEESVIVEKSWRLEVERAGNIASSVRKQREMNARALLPPPFHSAQAPCP